MTRGVVIRLHIRANTPFAVFSEFGKVNIRLSCDNNQTTQFQTFINKSETNVFVYIQRGWGGCCVIRVVH